MSLKNSSLHLDMALDRAELKILPSPISNNKVGWQDTTIKHFQTDSWEIGEHSHPHHELLIHLNCQTPVERKIDSRAIEETVTDGDLVIIPAGAEHKSLWRDKNEFVVLTLSPKVIEWYAWDSLNLNRLELLPTFAKPDPLVRGLISILEAEMKLNEDFDRLYGEVLISALCAHLLWRYTNQKPLSDRSNKLSSKQLTQAIEYINDNLHSSKLTLSEIAAQIGISKYHFCRLFTRTMNISPHQYIIRQRVKLAMQLLAQSKSAVETAQLCGFSHYTSLNRAFRKHLGISPKVYQVRVK